MFGFFSRKKKGTPSGSTIGDYNSGDPKIEVMKDEFFRYYKQGEAAGALMCDEYYQKAYDIGKEWVKVEKSNRSYGCLAGAALKLGVSNMDRKKVEEARDLYKMLAGYSSEYNTQLKMAEEILERDNDLANEIRKILSEGKKGSQSDL